MTTANPLARDLDDVLAQTPGLWPELRHARVFMTGGTGFFGCWLLETFLWANDHLGLEASVVVLTRNAAAFRQKAPHLAGHPAITLQTGDVLTLKHEGGEFSHVLHAATTSSSTVPPRTMFDTIVEGTRRTLELARRSGARRFLLTSSGAVYGRQPSDLTHVPEEYLGGPDPTDARHAYAEGKRAAEMLCAVYADGKVQPTIARCFAFVGPYLPLDAHFAIGNFIRDALAGGPIRVSGDGTPYRSYLYAADLAIWLWTILLRGEPLRPYNVGSEVAISIAALARAVAAQFAPIPPIRIAGSPVGAAVERYVPDTGRGRGELGFGASTALDVALARTVDWHRKRAGVAPC